MRSAGGVKESKSSDSCERSTPCRLRDFEGSAEADGAEVVEVKYVPLEELRADVQAQPERYTLWFREEAESLGWFGAH